MEASETLKIARDLLLKLHKSLVDFEKESYVAFNGPVTPAQFLSELLQNPDLEWLRKFSTLIVDIDEMFAQRDGYDQDAVIIHLQTMQALVNMEAVDDQLRVRYQLALQGDANAAAMQAELKGLLQ